MASPSEAGNTNELFECPMCLKRLVDPRYLPCLHTFCEACLNKCVSSKEVIQETNLPVFKCPVCNLAVKAPDPRTSTENWACLLPFNHLMCSLMEFTQQDENGICISCSPCKRGGEITKGLFWCHDCSDALCENCHVHHNRMRISVSHKVVPVERVSSSSVEIESFDKQCQDHPDNGAVLNSYCLDHNQPCCELCLTNKHSTCQNVCRLQDLTVKVKNENFVPEVLRQITDVDSEIRLVMTDKQRMIDRLDSRHKEIQDQVTELIANAKDKLDELHQNLKGNFETLHEKQKEMLVKKLKKIESFQNTVTYDQKIIGSLVDIKPCLPTYAAIERIKTQLLSNMGRLKSDFGEDESVEYEFHMDEIFEKISLELTSIGKIKVSTYPQSDTFTSLEKSVKAFNSIENNPSMKIPIPHSGKNGFRKSYIAAIEDVKEVKEDSSMDTQLSVLSEVSDTSPVMKASKVNRFYVPNSWVQSGAFYGNDILIFPNYYYEKLVFYDTKGNFIFEHYVYKKPWHVTVNDKGHVYVSYPDSGCIRKYKVKKGILFPSKTINTKERVEFFDVLGDCIVFVHGGNTLVIVNKKGKVIESLPIKCSKFATSGKDKVYYYSENMIKCWLSKDSESFSYKCPDEPIKIHVNQFGNIYLLFRKSELHIVSRDGVLLQNIEVKQSKEIEFVCFDVDADYCVFGSLKGIRYDPRKKVPERHWEGDAMIEYSEVSSTLRVELFKIQVLGVETRI